MKRVKELIRYYAREAWDDFCEPLIWLLHPKNRKKKGAILIGRRQTSPLRKISVTIVSASLASIFVFFFLDEYSQFNDFQSISIAMPGLIAIWSIAIIRILAVYLVQRKHRR